MAANWWLALIIIAVLNGIVLWEWFWSSEPVSKTARKWFFIVANAVGVCLAVVELIWLDL
ncbi:hypothetical protein PaecuDRAFT_4273 [Paenibacillus curdlanolyticus YK9]|uniref:Uncharacterized protein n=1 Tax=Paenibacillus curdlanolyticus YK9 TaxID=717606 RepID=E0IF32_9BACL|nr:hypothetical protein [Paenibacillus curdlanolyticus]EFM08808.1 hypothetical protein PaecuDRAFT_4273 [Paenibacillus curdlanolyticus YK9]